MQPTFLRQLLAPSVRRVLLCGCGGGFDFVHGLVLYEALREHAEEIVLGSYSFGDPESLGHPADEVFREGEAVVRRVDARAPHGAHDAPEVHRCRFLDRLESARSPREGYEALRALRQELGDRRRAIESLPTPRPWPLAPLFDPPDAPPT